MGSWDAMANSAVGFILIGHITPIIIQDERSKVVHIERAHTCEND